MTALPTCVVCLSGIGESAISVYQFHGRAAWLLADQHLELRNHQALEQLAVGRIHYGYWRHLTKAGSFDTAEQGDGREDIVVCRLSDQVAEVHTHGSPAVRQSMMETCKKAEIPFEFQPVAGKLECPRPLELHLDDARWTLSNSAHQTLEKLGFESLQQLQDWLAQRLAEALLKATSPSSVDVLLRMSQGSLLQAIIDLLKISDQPDLCRQELKALRETYAYGRYLLEPMVVLFTGAPNVGKSSLINRILGYQRTIVSQQAGTTRDLVQQDTTIDGLPFRLIDSAGIRHSDDPLEQLGIDRARDAQRHAQLILYVQSFQDSNPDVHLDQTIPTMTVYNKADLGAGDSPILQDSIVTSAVTGEGVPHLIQQISTRAQQAVGFPPDWIQYPVVFDSDIDTWLSTWQKQLLDATERNR